MSWDEDVTPIIRKGARSSWLARVEQNDPATAGAIRSLIANAHGGKFSPRELEETCAMILLRAIEQGLDRARHTSGEHQGPPAANNRPAAWDHVLECIHTWKQEGTFPSGLTDLFASAARARDNLGVLRYGTRLQPFNGRNAVVDAADEGLDMCAYLGQLQMEHDEKARKLRGIEAAGNDQAAGMAAETEELRAEAVGEFLRSVALITARLLTAHPDRRQSEPHSPA